MRTTTMRGLLAALLAALALVTAAACGDDSDGGSDGGDDEAAQPTDGGDATQGDHDEPGDDDRGDGSGNGGGGASRTGSSARFCAEIETATAAFDSMDDLPSGSEGAEVLISALAAVTPPPELLADWNTVLDSLRRAAAAVDQVDPDDPDGFARLQEELQDHGADLEQAEARIDAYLTDECGIGT